MEHLLDDITVIDAATFLAGPGAATILADFGANVIKIEPPGGDGYRALVGPYPVPYHWLLTSRNKKSLCVDMTKDAGQNLIRDLVAKADVFTSNFLPSQQKKFDVEYETLKAVNPRLIYAHISGYGTQGPDADRRAFDIAGWWARTGLMEFIREPGQTPLGMAPGMGDHCTATALFGAIMTGLYRRERTGEGSFVSTSLAANGIWANGMALQGVIAGNDIGTYRQAKGWPNPLTDSYGCADGRYLVLAIINTGREYNKLLEALDAQHLLADERFENPRAMMKNRPEFGAALREAFAKFESAEISKRLEAAGITHSAVVPMAETLTDEQMLANDIVIPTHDEGEGYALTINSPINVLQSPKKAPSRAPDVGAQTVEILRDMAFDERRISALLSDEIIFQPQSNSDT